MCRAAISTQTSAVECNGEQTVTPSANLILSPDTRLSHAPQSTVSPHILAIDDDPSIREAIADYLSDNDLRVTTLASCRELAELMARETIDLLLLDLRLPGEDALGIAPNLREDSTLPIIILTGRKDEADPGIAL